MDLLRFSTAGSVDDGKSTLIGRLLDGLLTLVGLVLWVVLMVQAYQGVKFKLPVVGDLAEARVRPGQ